MATLYFDFETYDPDLTDKGCGYIWDNVQIIGMGYKIDDEPAKYVTNTETMIELLTEHDTWVAHNINYELELAKYLGVDFFHKKVYCTIVGQYLINNNRMSYSLENLARELLGKNKDQARFGRLMLDEGVVNYPQKYYTTNDEEYKQKKEVEYLKKATNYAMGNLNVVHALAPELIEEYCKSDVELTYELHHMSMKALNIDTKSGNDDDIDIYALFSEVNKVLVEMRYKGVRVDLDRAESAKLEFSEQINQYTRELHELVGKVNYRSSKQLAEVFDSLGIEYPLTDKGNPKIDNYFLTCCEHPVARLIIDIKKLEKARDEFLFNIFKYQYNGRIHGQMMLFGARKTGRFSHKNPNLGQIPARDPFLGPIIRSIFIADEGEKWYSLDFSAQEPRITTHYSVLAHKNRVQYKKDVYDRDTKRWKPQEGFTTFDCPGVLDLQRSYEKTPDLDSHTYNMNIINNITHISIDRKSTKAIALGKAYGMGVKKLAKSLGLEYNTALSLFKAFEEGSPHLVAINDYVQHVMRSRGYIKTLGGRFVHNDGHAYKALNKLVQGSAADQTALAMLMMYKEYKIIPQIVVHDEVNFSGTMEEAEKVKHCMENVFQLEIPCLSDIGKGDNWSEAK